MTDELERQPEPAGEAEPWSGGVVPVGPGDASGDTALSTPEPQADARAPTSARRADGRAGAPRPAPADRSETTRNVGDASLLALIDRLAHLLERTDLAELEVAAGGTTVVLRAPSALERPAAAGHAPPTEATSTAPGAMPVAVHPSPAAERQTVNAPLTGIFYTAPTPGATPYVAVGGQVAIGQVIGLIEAMKLFNEIKSDRAGRVVRVCAENGALVKAKQPLIETEPL